MNQLRVELSSPNITPRETGEDSRCIKKGLLSNTSSMRAGSPRFEPDLASAVSKKMRASRYPSSKRAKLDIFRTSYYEKTMKQSKLSVRPKWGRSSKHMMMNATASTLWQNSGQIPSMGPSRHKTSVAL